MEEAPSETYLPAREVADREMEGHLPTDPREREENPAVQMEEEVGDHQRAGPPEGLPQEGPREEVRPAAARRGLGPRPGARRPH